MTESGIDLPESLAAAEERLSCFLQRNGYPPRVRWVVAEDIVFDSGRRCWTRADQIETGLAEARRRYSLGLVRNLGIALNALCASETETFAAVFIPTDETDAESHLMGRCLKMSCPVTKTRASTVSNRIRWLYLRLRNHNLSRMWRESLQLFVQA